MQWNLQSLYSTKEINAAMDTIADKVRAFHTNQPATAILDAYQDIKLLMREVESFILCLTSQDVHDKEAEQMHARLLQLDAAVETLDATMNAHFATLSEEELGTLLHKPYVHIIKERIEQKRHSDESLLNDLSVDGFHGWSQMYDTVMSTIHINDGGKELSFGQAENLLGANDPEKRKIIFEKLEAAFDEKAPLFARILNHIAGFRIELNKRRGYSHYLDEPLANNRMQKETLTAMWQAIEEMKEPIIRYFETKKQRLGLTTLSYYDLEASIPHEHEKTIPYAEAQKRILEAFTEKLPQMATFSKRAFDEEWIEAEDRNGKRPGGFCTDFPVKKESRIFMTYSGSLHNLLTLAHELGHAFHNEVTFDLPEVLQHFRMNVAETASLTAENCTLDYITENATPEEKLQVLDDKLNRAMIFLTNIRARFLFETAFYDERQHGYVSEERLCELMVDAQKKAYHGCLDTYHPYFWAAKLHFFFTSSSFYNFPYTFGYLFSNGICACRETLSNFEETYIEILRESGMMPVETLAKKHLKLDLTKVDFWKKALQPIIQDIEEYACESSQPSLQ